MATSIPRAASAAHARRQPGETRSRTFDAISLATGYLLDAQLDQMEPHGHLAIDMATDVASARAVDRLVAMAALAQPQAGHSGVAGVLERIDALAGS